MNWSVQASWPTQPIPVDPMARYDAMGRDEVLIEWQRLQTELANAKVAEMEMRKYVVKRAFPDATEGTNKLELGQGYELKATVKYNYNLDTDLDKVEAALDKIATFGNEGSFIADRLVKWSASFLLTEYRKLEADDATDIQKAIKKEIDNVLTITDAAPSLEIKAPGKKK